MMKLHELKARLGARPEARIIIALPDGGEVPRHFHVTEVGHVSKRFVDCGGTFRSSDACVLQTWTGVEQDDGHRLTAGKLVKILGLAKSILPTDELPVEVEFEAGVVSQFPISEISGDGEALTLHLSFKHTDCLAREKCRAPGDEACCAESEVSCGAGQGCC